jgi:hypothetical protein
LKSGKWYDKRKAGIMEAKHAMGSPYLFTAEKFGVIKRGKDKIII